ncbi:MAG: Chaperone ClpB [Parcubacteria group bacterium GW2011_GWA2_39_18]|nr:MAG: Chaperone ClpB [Parcubacteria group bacterium GW2011_GWA2_39_18]
MFFDFIKNKFIGAFVAENVFPVKIRRIFKLVLTPIILIFLVAIFYNSVISQISFEFLTKIKLTAFKFPLLPISNNTLWGCAFLVLSIRLFILAFEFFIFSKTKEIKNIETPSNLADRFNIYVSEIWYKAGMFASTKDLAEAVLSTTFGQSVLLRLGIFSRDYKNLISQISKESWIAKDVFLGNLQQLADSNSVGSEISSAMFLETLFKSSAELNQFFISKEIFEEDIQGAANWMEGVFSEGDRAKRWWLRENLGRISGIGKNWAFGKTYFLERFSYDIHKESVSSLHIVGHDKEIKMLEAALLKQGGANVVLVGEPGSGKNTILLGLAKMIEAGKVFPELEHKRIFKLSGPAIVASAKTKGEVEEALMRMFNEAMRAGDIILVIEDFPELVKSLEELGIVASQVLSPYLQSSIIHVLALANTASFRKILENDSAIMKHFEKIEIYEPAYKELVEILQDLDLFIEASNSGKTLVTYQAIKKIAEASQQYLVNGALPERAIGLLQEIAAQALSSNIGIVSPEFVLEFISQKTKMPLGKISQEEQKELVNLEAKLHERVIGQNEAIDAIADTIRRARVGIQEKKKPIGSFLFLGPTGVGKTETAKSLAEVYFGNEEKMIRLDMTEYQNDSDLEKLLGSFEKNEPGILVSNVRAMPYGVVLLDEFEKANQKVIDLFLQVLDEGFFSDAFGQKINMRNNIIVATSNAGSRIIWDLINKGSPLEEVKKAVMENIQKEGKFKPELLNRFDATIVFRPIDQSSIKSIAQIMIKKFAGRLAEKNISLEINQDLIDAVAKGGYDPAFGARPMRRFLQEKIEKLIADKMIRGELKPGSRFSLSEEELV